MGAPYLSTFIFSFLFAKTNPFKSVNLTNKNIIIDGYSLFYFTYYMILQEDKDKDLPDRITAVKFAYDSLSKSFREYLQKFQEKCANVCIVFDGNYEPKKHQRPDPQRASSIRFNKGRCRLPPLLHDQLMSIARDLGIKVHIAPDEADPVIVQIARKYDAYIVARDTDYFLYGETKGYVPLNTLDLPTLNARYYHMEDVFQKMTQEGVALWATTIIYDFIKFDVLEKNFQMKKAHDAQDFRRWLSISESDDEKCQRIRCLYNMLRYIQEVGHDEAYTKIFDLVPEEHIDLFRESIENYINIPSFSQKLTRNENKMHSYLSEMCECGKLDPDVTDILFRRHILYLWKGTNPIHLQLLLPMCSILIKWDYSTSRKRDRSSALTFNGQTYDPLELHNSDNLPTLDELCHLDSTRAKKLVRNCVDLALGSEEQFQWNEIHDDYKLPLSILKLWLHKKSDRTKSLEVTLMALIISFLKYMLLNTYGETKGKHDEMISERIPIAETLPKKPYRQYSYKDLRSYISLEKCAHLRKDIKNYAKLVLSDETIEKEIEECQQFYKELTIINQFFKQPFHMPRPDLYFNRLTHRLAVTLNQSKNFRKDIRTLFSEYPLLTEFIDELHDFFIANVPSHAE